MPSMTKVTAHSYVYRKGGKVVGTALLFTNPQGSGVVNHFETRLPSGEVRVGQVVATTWSAARDLLRKQCDGKLVERRLNARDVRLIINTAETY